MQHFTTTFLTLSLPPCTAIGRCLLLTALQFGLAAALQDLLRPFTPPSTQTLTGDPRIEPGTSRMPRMGSAIDVWPFPRVLGPQVIWSTGANDQGILVPTCASSFTLQYQQLPPTPFPT